MLSSETPAWKKAPLKSPRLKACVFFRKPSVLSELERSAEATTMFSTCVASAPNTTADAARVATSAFCWIASQFTFGAFPEKNSANLAASSGFSFAHSALAAYFSATIFFRSSARFAYSSATSGKMVNGSSGLPPRFLIVLIYASPPNGAPCVAQSAS